MKKLELLKGLSYSTMSFSAIKGVPFYVEDDEADKLMKTGRFKEITEDTGAAEVVQKSVDKMKLEELNDYANKLKVDITGCGNNEERKAAIKAAIKGEEDTAADTGTAGRSVPGYSE